MVRSLLTVSPSERANPRKRLAADGPLRSNGCNLWIKSIIGSIHRVAPEILELEAVHKDGHTLPVETHASLLLNEQGRPVEILGEVRDITKRKQAEKALQESESKFQDLYENAPDMFISVDAETGTIVQCNQTFVAASGYSKEELMGRSVFDIYTSDSAEHAKLTVSPLFVKTGSIKDEQLQILRRDGSTLFVG